MGLFSHSSSQNNSTCPAQSLAEDALEPFISNFSFYQFNMILSGSCAAFACTITFVLMIMHATHFSNPSEQSKIMRIAGLIPLYSILSFLSICFPTAFVYLVPWATFFQAIALANFFLLMCEFVSPNPAQRDVIFATLEVPSKNGVPRAGGLRWFMLKWIMIFQYPIVSVLASVATDATQAANFYCLYSSKPYFAHLWISIVQNISIVFAVLAIFQFYKALRTRLASHQPLLKLVAFKLIVFLTFLQGIIFWILRDINALNPTSKLTFADLNIGIPTLIICLEMVPISIFFYFAYSVQRYIIRRSGTSSGEPELGNRNEIQDGSYHGGILGIKAWVAMCNPIEILRGIGVAFKMISEWQQESAAERYRAGGFDEPLKDQDGRVRVLAA